MDLKIVIIEKVQTLIKSKHGKSILIGSLAVIMAITMIGISLVGENLSKTNIEVSESIVEKPAEVKVQDTSKDAAVVLDDKERFGDINSDFSAINDPKECDNRFPNNGFIRIFRKDWEALTLAKSELQIDNKTDTPIWLKLMHPTAGFPVLGIIVHPFETTTTRVNIGLYGVEFTKGVQWCNQFGGITDGKTLVLSKNMPLSKANSVLLRVTSDADGQVDMVMVDMPRLTGFNANSAPILVEKR